MSITTHTCAMLGLTALVAAFPSAALGWDWADTSIGWRYGTDFAEPYARHDIRKHIFNLTHADGYAFGTNYLNIDYLVSDDNNPSKGSPTRGAEEYYVVYRHTLNIGRVLDREFAFGPVRGLGLTAGFDWNTKNDHYGSKKHLFVLGPTLMMDVRGMLNISLLAREESNFPDRISSRYDYDRNLMLGAVWKIPVALGDVQASFEGFGNWIESKGKNEFGGKTAPEINIDASLMFDVGSLLGGPSSGLKAGLEYQYWRNKFGNPASVPGALAHTPMVRVEYHF